MRTASDICRCSSHADRNAVLADLYFCFGAFSMDESNFVASTYYKEKSFDLLYDICERRGIEDERLYLAYAERGISRIQDQRYAEAEVDLREALRLRKSFGTYIPAAGEANLGWALLLQGRHEECEVLLLESLRLRQEALGGNDRESVRTGLLLSVIGNLRAAQGRLDDSRDFHSWALRHMRGTVGDRDPYTSRAMHKMAEHYLREGREREAM